MIIITAKTMGLKQFLTSGSSFHRFPSTTTTTTRSSMIIVTTPRTFRRPNRWTMVNNRQQKQRQLRFLTNVSSSSSPTTSSNVNCDSSNGGSRSFGGVSQPDESRPNSILSNRNNLSSPSSNGDGSTNRSIPFYGLPQQKRQQQMKQPYWNTVLQFPTILQEFVHQTYIAYSDPTRADAVAAIGEMTGQYQLYTLRSRMQSNVIGQQILHDRPIVSKSSQHIEFDTIMERAKSIQQQYGPVPTTYLNPLQYYEALVPKDQLTFGIAYGLFLLSHDFDPDERDDVRYIPTSAGNTDGRNQYDDIAYIMLRYRQCHDYWHVLTCLPPNVNGEIGLKVLELFHMNLPIAAYSTLSYSVQQLLVFLQQQQQQVMHGNAILNTTNTSTDNSNTKVSTDAMNELHMLWNLYVPWAREQCYSMQHHNICLLNVYYEKEFHTPLYQLRQKLHLQPFDVVV